MLSGVTSYLFGTRPKELEPTDGDEAGTKEVDVPTRDGELGWVIVDTPEVKKAESAKRKNSCNVDTNPLENLLIEHPSMSVYTSLECDEKANAISQDSGDMEVEASSAAVVTAACRDKKRVTHQPPRRARAVAARAGLIAQIENIKEAQREQTRWVTKKLSRKLTNKENKVREHSALGKQQSKRARIQKPSGCMSGRMGQRKL
ncbi:tumor protein p53-inducible nuclear protein 2-like [Gigantopelta aegis]|uniref:tumor protein p53-inducible nuclear protein 2-like n=1 Tax=Gigantopelta aegis TaxID=1735272 RepID=UPI001B88CAF6|nr:tumor protein p53-inducible nuclear protein 2-like [Gigantopelta aegis]